MTWTDSHGLALTDYPRPSVAVDVALLTVLPGTRRSSREDRRRPGLAVLAHPRDGGWSLPGTFVHERERLRDAALRALETKTGVRGESPQQLRVFDDPDRDPRGWVLSVTHVDLVPVERLADVAADCRLAPVVGTPPRLQVDGEPASMAFDHGAIVADAVAWARAAYADRPDPGRLLGEVFTLSELRRVHEAVLGVELPRDTFRRGMEPLVRETGEVTRGTVGKPARLFRRRD